MNKLRNMRHKSPANHDESMPPGEDHVRGVSGGLFNKIKRYSNASHKLMRRSSGNHQVATTRKHSPHRSSSGSYDMTGESSRDLRPEIGAPVLITTTALDIDNIFDKITENKSVIPASSSSDSDADVFADASASIQDFSNIKFQFFEEGTSVDNTQVNLSTSTEEGDYELVPSPRIVQLNSSESERRRSPVDQVVIPQPMRKNKSRSVSNLHSPSRKLSLELNIRNLRRHPVSTVDLRTPAEYSDNDEDVSGYYNEPYDGSDKENSSAVCNNNKERCNNSGDGNEQPAGRELEGFKRSLSVVILHQTQTYDEVADVVPKSMNSSGDKSVTFSDSKVMDEEDESRDKSMSSMSDDFDMKSASFEDLQENGQMFLSIEEFNALTKEINESEEFNNSITEIIDPEEYCDHRSNLRPNQRRVTLMRNKPNKIQLNLNDKRGKITSVWSGIKHWIDEERGKIKEVVQRHSAMQRVGANLKSPTTTAEGGAGGIEENVAVKRVANQSREENVDHDRELEARDDLDNGFIASAERDSRDLSSVFHTVLRQKSKTSGTSAATTNAIGTAAEVII